MATDAAVAEEHGGPGLELVEADDATFAQRPTPWSEDIEVAALGAALIDREARAELLQTTEAEDFHKAAHRHVRDAIARLHERGVPEMDVMTLTDELESADKLEAAGGMKYLAGLMDVPTAANLPHHVERLQELRALRDVQTVAESLMWASSETKSGEVGAVLEDARETLREVGERAGVDDDALRTAREILDDPEARVRPPVVANLVAYVEQVVLLAAREKDGKSTLLRWTAARVSSGIRAWGSDTVPEGPCDVLYFGQERPVDVASDLESMGADLERVHIRDMRRLTGDRFAALRRDLDAVDPAMLVVDTLSTFVDQMDLDPGSSADWEPVMNRFGALAQETETAVVLSHHARKSDGEYRDSTAIGAGVDAILELRRDPTEGERVRKVKAKARSAVPTRDFSYSLVGTEARPRLQLLDGSLSVEERVQRFVADHEGCSQREVLEGVRGKRDDIRDTLKALSEDGGPVVEDASSTPYSYRIAQTPQGNGTETGRERSGNGGTDSRGRSVPCDPGAPTRGPGQGTQAGSVDDDGDEEEDEFEEFDSLPGLDP